MNRRSILMAGLTAAVMPTNSMAELQQPWRAKLLKGGFDGKYNWAGLHVILDGDWKTYWRVPGSGGIAPQIDVKGDNIKSSFIKHPLPKRYVDESGEAIGYKHEVVFLIAIEPKDLSKPVVVSISSFMGVCEIVCIPAQFSGSLSYSSATPDAPDQALLNQWQKQIPKPTTVGPITSATSMMLGGKPILHVVTGRSLVDIFIEGQPQHYFGAPLLTKGLFIIPVSGVTELSQLQGQSLLFTIDDHGVGLEQMVMVV